MLTNFAVGFKFLPVNGECLGSLKFYSIMHKYFNPNKFLKIANILLPYIIGIFLISFISGMYFALFASPPDYQQGESVRIMYVHVPSAWMSLGIYSFIAFMSIACLVWKSPFSSLLAYSAAPIGIAFNIICLVTGSLWGKPIWGDWWVWDARLTSVLILLFFYIGYYSLYNSFDDKNKAANSASVLAIVGLINIPIIKFSVDWWNTLHQPASIIRSEGVAIDNSMLLPLMLMFCSFVAFFLMLLVIRVKAEVLISKYEKKKLL